MCALPRISTRVTKKCLKFALVLICALALASCGGGGGGGSAGASGAGGVRTVSSQELPSDISNGKNYGIDKNAPAITPSLPSTGGASTASTPPRGTVTTAPNKQAEGSGIYSEALQSEGVNTVHLELTIDGVTTVHELAGSGSTLQLQTVGPGTQIAVSGTVITGKKKRNIVPKTYSIESFQNVLPLFVEYEATFDTSSVGGNPTTIKYSTDKAIELPILPDKEVDGALALFTGWQVKADGLSIDGNYYERGANVSAGELCGDITFVPDYAFGVKFEDDDGNVIAFDEGNLNVIEKTSASFAVVDVSGTDITNNANTSISVNSSTVKYDNTANKFNFGPVGSAIVEVTGTTLQGKAYRVKFSINVTELVFDEDYHAKNTEFPVSTAKHLDQLAKLMKDGKSFASKTITLEGDISASSTFNGFDCGTSGFAGTFDGGNNTVTVNINGGQVALFNNVSAGGTIKNLTVAGSITGQNGAAGIAAWTESGSTIENCVNTATITAKGCTGGICAFNGGAIRHCINKGNISAQSIQNDETVGGIAGCCMDTGLIEECANLSASVKITGSHSGLVAGGITGSLGATVRNCYINGTSVSANTHCGGIVGKLDAGPLPEVLNCYVANATINDMATNANPCVGNATTASNCKNLYYINTKYSNGVISPVSVSDNSVSESAMVIAGAITLDSTDASGLPIIVVP